MRRLFALGVVLAAGGLFAGLSGCAISKSTTPHYSVMLDNAFGLVTGADLKVAGVRAGKITTISLNQRTLQAKVSFEITERGFGSLRSDVHCSSRPQSLIGEYFLDCLPGTSPVHLKSGAVIPVQQTDSTVAPDLVNDVLREPYRERLAIIINELGAAVAGNGQALNDAIRRASPGLRETDKVLATLAGQRKVLADLTTNANKVVSDLANNRADVQRWVVKAGDTSRASAARAAAIAQGFRRLPGFLEQLQPAMKSLGNVADNQTPALVNLKASADTLRRFFVDLKPFSNASKPAIAALGKASVTGDSAVKAAGPTVRELNRFSTGTPELAQNLSIILQHIDDRQYATTPGDPRSPGGKGYTGFEALLQYVMDQATATNIYDQNEHLLNISLVPPTSACSNYADIAYAKAHPECLSALGPNIVGLNFPDPTASGNQRAKKHSAKDGSDPFGTPLQVPLFTPPASPPGGDGGSSSTPPATTTTSTPTPPAPTVPSAPTVSVPSVPPVHVPLPQVGGNAPGNLPAGRSPVAGLRLAAQADARRREGARHLLDYLLGS